MFGWFKWGKRDALQVKLANDVIQVEVFANELTITPNRDLAEWLIPYKGQYKLGYDPKTGKRWVEFDDKNVAIMCRLVFA